MPTYEYLCKKCGHRFEQFQSMKEEPLKECPVCQKDSLVRLVSGGAGLIFKGSGFYITDYKNSHTSSSNGNGEKAKPEAKSAGKENEPQKK
ncbi:MAG TPA: zinc ribbon domain-containing protein [bacterium]|jgi:putative FmdB family regulatory protein|nr:zinc ribbon domain-containing protein [bacterium]HNT65793.1 zinc ribbon domain-containing protein [bacterium]HOX85482.1 zinc ribbon domain-containing protein [bacterium]HPG44641.1 zinc ribbon domain-containing protein [bacterium]HPM97199.1 zinc ribbon domain-containing protein [bacterium]